MSAEREYGRSVQVSGGSHIQLSRKPVTPSPTTSCVRPKSPTFISTGSSSERLATSCS